MGRLDWYTVKAPSGSDDYHVIKFSDDPAQPDEHIYHVGKQGANIAMCDCYAGQKYCRHKKMVAIFDKENRINSGWKYQFDKQKWQAPPKLET